jgi:hypothetical protein
MCEPNDDFSRPLAREGELRELPPRRTTLSFSPTGQLRLTVDGRCSYRAVRLVRCFPVSDPNRHVSVRCALTEGNPEIAVISDLDDLSASDRRAADEHLNGSCLLSEIQEVSRLKRDFGYLYWKTETDRGAREFATRDSQEGVTKLPDGGAVVTDTDDCRYRIPALGLLNRSSRSLLARYLFL